MPLNLLLIGPTNSNKLTISQQIATEFNLTFIPLHQTLLEEISKNSGYGTEAKKYFDSESTVPDDLIFDVLLSRLQPIEFTNFIISGFPSTLSQARVFEFYLRKNNIQLNAVICSGTNETIDSVVEFFKKKNILVINSDLDNVISQIKKLNVT